MRRLLRPLLILVALVFLFEAWLWSHLAPIVAWIVARIPLRAIKARLTALLDRLPPAATLVVFIVPVLLLLPLKGPRRAGRTSRLLARIRRRMQAA